MRRERSCELLSKIIIFVTRNNVLKLVKNNILVVNCFQKLLSSWRGTTVCDCFRSINRLWIAFKNYYLRDEEQPFWQIVSGFASCELLSKIIIFVTRNNQKIMFCTNFPVVNCFQKLLSSWRGTTKYLVFDVTARCELLSKIIIFVTRNNNFLMIICGAFVVNCFQKLLSSWRGTTHFVRSSFFIKLWIAFKNYYLRDEEQRKKRGTTK